MHREYFVRNKKLRLTAEVWGNPSRFIASYSRGFHSLYTFQISLYCDVSAGGWGPSSDPGRTIGGLKAGVRRRTPATRREWGLAGCTSTR